MCMQDGHLYPLSSLQGLKKKRSNELEGFGADGMVILRQLQTFERLLVRCIPNASDETVVNLFLSLAECMEAMGSLTREIQLASVSRGEWEREELRM